MELNDHTIRRPRPRASADELSARLRAANGFPFSACTGTAASIKRTKVSLEDSPKSHFTMLSYSILFSTLAALAVASPVVQSDTLVTRNWSKRTQTCIVPSQWDSSNGTADDTQAIHDTFAKCNKNAVVVFEEGVN